MKKDIVFKEFPNEKQALSGYDEYTVTKYVLKKGDKNYSGTPFGNYLPLFPVSIFGNFKLVRKKGWMCKVIDKGTFKILLNSNLSNIYLKCNSDSSYLGIEYVSSDLGYSKLNQIQFVEEYLDEVSKMEETDEFEIQHKKKCLENLNKIVDNFEKNLSYFDSINNVEFENELNRIVLEYNFKKIEDTTSYKNCLYILVFDEYKQFYVGKCVGGLKNRTRKHWNAKIIPDRQIWDGGFEFSRIKVDNFKMFDTTRIFVCDDTNLIIGNNLDLINDPRIEVTNTYGFGYYENMDLLDKVERTVINNCLCKFCLSDRTPIIDFNVYEELARKYGLVKEKLLIKHYLKFDEYRPSERTPDTVAFINRLNLKRKK